MPVREIAVKDIPPRIFRSHFKSPLSIALQTELLEAEKRIRAGISPGLGIEITPDLNNFPPALRKEKDIDKKAAAKIRWHVQKRILGQMPSQSLSVETRVDLQNHISVYVSAPENGNGVRRRRRVMRAKAK
jgi:hypothetical protein